MATVDLTSTETQTAVFQNVDRPFTVPATTPPIKIPDHPNLRFPHDVSQWVTVGEVLRCWKVPKSFLEMLARSPEGEPLLVPHPPGGDGMIFAQGSRTEMFKTVFTLSKKGQGAQLFDAIQEEWVYPKTFVLAFEEKNPRVILRAPGAVSISQARKREDDQPLLSDALEYQLTQAKFKEALIKSPNWEKRPVQLIDLKGPHPTLSQRERAYSELP